MANVPYNQGVPTVPSLSGGNLPDVYDRNQPLAAEGLQKLGSDIENKLGAGFMEAGKHYAQVSADNGINQLQKQTNDLLYGDPTKFEVGPDGAPVLGPDGKPMRQRGYNDLTGEEGANARPVVSKKLEDIRSGIANGLSGEARQIFETASRRYHGQVLNDVGQKDVKDRIVWATEVNKSTYENNLNFISLDPMNDEKFKHSLEDMRQANVKNVNLGAGVDQNSPMGQEALNRATRDAWTARINALAARGDQAMAYKAYQMLRDNPSIFGADYDALLAKIGPLVADKISHARAFDGLQPPGAQAHPTREPAAPAAGPAKPAAELTFPQGPYGIEKSLSALAKGDVKGAADAGSGIRKLAMPDGFSAPGKIADYISKLPDEDVAALDREIRTNPKVQSSFDQMPATIKNAFTRRVAAIKPSEGRPPATEAAARQAVKAEGGAVPGGTPVASVAAAPAVSVTGKPVAAPAGYRSYYEQSGAKYNVDPAILAAQGKQESGFNARIISPAGAIGIAQFMPGTAARYKINPRDPVQSIEGQAHYMRDLLDMFHGDYKLALMGYNWGEGNVQRWLANGSDPNRVPAETRNYVAAITGTKDALGLAERAQVTSGGDVYGGGAGRSIGAVAADNFNVAGPSLTKSQVASDAQAFFPDDPEMQRLYMQRGDALANEINTSSAFEREQAKQKSVDRMQFYVAPMVAGNPPPDILSQIAQDKDLLATDKEALRNAVISHAHDSQADATAAYGRDWYPTFLRLTKPVGDPDRISEIADIYKLVPGGRLTLAGADDLAKIANSVKRDVDQVGINEARAAILDKAKRYLSVEPGMSIPGMTGFKDPAGQDKFDTYIIQFQSAYALASQKPGFDPMEFLRKTDKEEPWKALRTPGEIALAKMQATENIDPSKMIHPPAPQGVDQAGWTVAVNAPPLTKAGQPWPAANWVGALTTLATYPTKQVMGDFDQYFADNVQGYRAADVLAVLGVEPHERPGPQDRPINGAPSAPEAASAPAVAPTPAVAAATSGAAATGAPPALFNPLTSAITEVQKAAAAPPNMGPPPVGKFSDEENPYALPPPPLVEQLNRIKAASPVLKDVPTREFHAAVQAAQDAAGAHQPAHPGTASLPAATFAAREVMAQAIRKEYAKNKQFSAKDLDRMTEETLREILDQPNLAEH